MGIEKQCSKCKTSILCRADTITECSCSQLTLSKDTLDFLQNTSYDCLCNNCLIDAEKKVKDAHSATQKMTENVHYYLEDGMLVFTELYHIQRGYCCKSGCRHCAYGFTPKN